MLYNMYNILQQPPQLIHPSTTLTTDHTGSMLYSYVIVSLFLTKVLLYPLIVRGRCNEQKREWNSAFNCARSRSWTLSCRRQQVCAHILASMHALERFWPRLVKGIKRQVEAEFVITTAGRYAGTTSAFRRFTFVHSFIFHIPSGWMILACNRRDLELLFFHSLLLQPDIPVHKTSGFLAL